MNQSKNILHITQSSSSGGVVTSIIMTCTYLRDFGYNCIIIGNPNSALEKKALINNFQYIPTKMVRPFSFFSDLKSIGALIIIFKETKISLIHAHSSKAGALLRIMKLLRIIDIPLVFNPRAYSYLSTTGIKRKIFLYVEIVLGKFQDKLIACSVSESRRAVEDVKIKKRLVTVIPNSVQKTNKPKINPLKEPIKIIQVGRYSYQKNHDMAFRLIAELESTNVHYKYSFIGVKDSNTVKKKLPKIINGEITIVDWMDHKKTLIEIKKSDIMILTSLYEGMPNVILEALSVGTPVIATDVDGNNDLIIDGYNGFLVPLDDYKMMGKKIIAILNNEVCYSELSKNSINHIKKKYLIKYNIQKLIGVYSNLIFDKTKTKNCWIMDMP